MGQRGGLGRDIPCCGVSIWKGFLEDTDPSRKSFFLVGVGGVLYRIACGLLVSEQGLNPGLWQWTHGILPTVGRFERDKWVEFVCRRRGRAFGGK